MSDAPVLELSSVTAGYGQSIVLRDIDLMVGAGEVVALLGPNGAGKTTLLRAASGLLKPQDGTVSVKGEDMTRKPGYARARSGLCLIPEGRGIFGDLSVRENLRLLVPPWEKNVDMDRALDAFPILRERLDQRAGSMSGGQQQMLALARCWLCNPSCVLLDEVSMGLAPRVVDEIFEALTQLASEGIALLVVEQYVDRALAIADRVQLLDRGRTSFVGPTTEIDRDAVLQGYLGADVEASTNGSTPSTPTPTRKETP
jgi:branched-chain amino acid transport system ATP-binding protein